MAVGTNFRPPSARPTWTLSRGIRLNSWVGSLVLCTESIMSPKPTKSATLAAESDQSLTASNPEPAGLELAPNDLAEVPVLALPAVSLLDEAVVPMLNDAALAS